MKLLNLKLQLGLLAAISLSAPALSHASSSSLHGYLCGSADRELLVRVYELVPGPTAPKGQAMVLTDPTADQAHQVIGAIKDTDLIQTRTGLEFQGNAQNAVPGPSPFIDGVPLTNIQWVILGVDLTSSNTALTAGSVGILSGSLRIQKANGQISQKTVTCTRF